MRHFLIAYFHQGGKGRSFVTTPDDRVVTSSIIEDWEALIAEDFNLKNVGITSFQALEGPPEGAGNAPTAY